MIWVLIILENKAVDKAIDFGISYVASKAPDRRIKLIGKAAKIVPMAGAYSARSQKAWEESCRKR